MTSSKRQILASLAHIEQRVPLFFGNIPVPDDQARELFAQSMAELKDSPDFRRAPAACRETALLASLAHALLDAAALRQQLQQRHQAAGHAARRLIAKVAAL
ncbi:MAG: hypothetical protein H7Z19_14580 [Chitinophagaceae bacterium]|nr:hypothetical protein [Rubrivivax sp.]